MTRSFSLIRCDRDFSSTSFRLDSWRSSSSSYVQFTQEKKVMYERVYHKIRVTYNLHTVPIYIYTYKCTCSFFLSTLGDTCVREATCSWSLTITAAWAVVTAAAASASCFAAYIHTCILSMSKNSPFYPHPSTSTAAWLALSVWVASVPSKN